MSTTRCGKCVLPLSLTTLGADEHNVCNLCRQYESVQHPAGAPRGSQDDLEEQIEHLRERGKGKPYDALLGLSGGRDSSYLAYLMVRKHKLRCVAAYYRTPFTQDFSDGNVRRITERLGMPLAEIRGPEEKHLKAAREYFLLWRKRPRYEYAALCCAGCKMLNCEVFRIARSYGAPSIVFAGNTFEAVQFLPTFRKTSSSRKGQQVRAQLSKTIRILGKGLRTFTHVPPSLLGMSFKASVLYLSPHALYLRMRFPDIHRMDYFYYAPWREKECLDAITGELGWEIPEGSPETWKLDCDFAAIKNYMFYKMVGASYTDALYSNLIRAGQITREEAIRRLRAGAGLSMECMERAMSRMGLPMDLIDREAIDRALDA